MALCCCPGGLHGGSRVRTDLLAEVKIGFSGERRQGASGRKPVGLEAQGQDIFMELWGHKVRRQLSRGCGDQVEAVRIGQIMIGPHNQMEEHGPGRVGHGGCGEF